MSSKYKFIFGVFVFMITIPFFLLNVCVIITVTNCYGLRSSFGTSGYTSSFPRSNRVIIFLPHGPHRWPLVVINPLP